MCGFVCGKVVEVVGYYAVEEVFASYCNQSATPLGVFGVVVSSGYESIAQRDKVNAKNRQNVESCRFHQ